MSDNPNPPQPTAATQPAVEPSAADPRRSRREATAAVPTDASGAPLTHSTAAAEPAVAPRPGQVHGYHAGTPWAGHVRYVCEGIRLGKQCGFDELNESRMIDHVMTEHPEIA